MRLWFTVTVHASKWFTTCLKANVYVWNASYFRIFFQAVKNFLEKTAQGAWDTLIASTHDTAWAYGPFGEQFGTFTFAFLGSTVGLQAASPLEGDEGLSPLPNEPFLTIDWNLPMTGAAQEMLFKRVRSVFDRTTQSVQLTQKKKCRMPQDEMMKLRNIIVLFDQIRQHLGTRLSAEAVAAWAHDLESTSRRDRDLGTVFEMRPAVFAMSMLPSEQEAAKEGVQAAEQKKVEDKEQQRQEVVNAQWAFFQGALKRDYAKLEVAQQAPRLVRQKLHAKQVLHRSQLAKDGEAACRAYQDRGEAVES